MSDVLGGFIDRKKADSDFISLKDGEELFIKALMKLDTADKEDYNGNPTTVLRLSCLVDTPYGERVKSFDNGTQKFAEELQTKGVQIGSSFTISRSGISSQTKYIVTGVTHHKPQVAPAPAPAPAAPAPAPAVAHPQMKPAPVQVQAPAPSEAPAAQAAANVAASVPTTPPAAAGKTEDAGF